MTHDELLARISLVMPKDNSNVYIEDVVTALRAVVELCKKAENDIDVSGFAEGIIEAIKRELA